MSNAPRAGQASSGGNNHSNHKRHGDASSEPNGVRGWFRRFAHQTATAVGTPWAFTGAVLIILAWGVTGPIFRYSDTWQLVINTGTTIITFLMVFLIQNTQNRDARAMHLKLDELIRSVKGARNGLVDLESLSDEELDRLQQEFARLRERTDRRKMHGVREAADQLHQQVHDEVIERRSE